MFLTHNYHIFEQCSIQIHNWNDGYRGAMNLDQRKTKKKSVSKICLHTHYVMCSFLGNKVSAAFSQFLRTKTTLKRLYSIFIFKS